MPLTDSSILSRHTVHFGSSVSSITGRLAPWGVGREGDREGRGGVERQEIYVLLKDQKSVAKGECGTGFAEVLFLFFAPAQNDSM